MDAVFSPARFSLARQRRALNQEELAERANVAVRGIRAYESGETEPSLEVLQRCATALSFPVSFFFGPSLDIPSIDSVSFRSMKSMKAAERDAARAAGALAFELARWIDERFKLEAVDLPDFGRPPLEHAALQGDISGMPPENAAIALRERWCLGQRSVPSMVHLLEKHGVRVFSLAEKTRTVDAYSLWHGNEPYCFLNTMKTVEHSRMDAAHELGHLILHRHGAPQGQRAEREAQGFAAAFLMPRESVRAYVPKDASLAKLIELKQLWNVSAAALAHRAHKVGMLSEWHYRGICIEMNKIGRTVEPAPMTNRETSQVFTKVFAALREEGISKTDVARELNVYTADLDALIFGLTLTQLNGGGRTLSPAAERARAQLRLLTSRPKPE